MSTVWTAYLKCYTVHPMSLKSSRILQLLEDFFFPSICEGCGKVGTYLCDKCAKKKIKIRIKQQCHVCKEVTSSGFVHERCKSSTNLDGVFVIAEYSKFIEDYIGDIKYEFYFAMISDLVKITNKTLVKNSQFVDLIEEGVLTFVPLVPARKRWRGFNQAEKIAIQIARYWNVKCLKLLKRVKRTKSQVGLKRKQRLKNIKGAFEFIGDIDSLKDLNVIVVDDVMTSGGTIEECAKTLKACGCKRVYGLVFARG